MPEKVTKIITLMKRRAILTKTLKETSMKEHIKTESGIESQTYKTKFQIKNYVACRRLEQQGYLM